MALAQVWERAVEWASGDDGGGLRAVAVSDELSVEGRGQLPGCPPRPVVVQGAILTCHYCLSVLTGHCSQMAQNNPWSFWNFKGVFFSPVAVYKVIL